MRRSLRNIYWPSCLVFLMVLMSCISKKSLAVYPQHRTNVLEVIFFYEDGLRVNMNADPVSLEELNSELLRRIQGSRSLMVLNVVGCDKRIYGAEFTEKIGHIHRIALENHILFLTELPSGDVRAHPSRYDPDWIRVMQVWQGLSETH